MSNQQSHIFVCSSGFLVNLDNVSFTHKKDIVFSGASTEYYLNDTEKAEIRDALIAYGEWKAKAMSGQLMMEAMQKAFGGKWQVL